MRKGLQEYCERKGLWSKCLKDESNKGNENQHQAEAPEDDKLSIVINKGDANRPLFDLSSSEDKDEDKDETEEDKRVKDTDKGPALEEGEKAKRGGARCKAKGTVKNMR